MFDDVVSRNTSWGLEHFAWKDTEPPLGVPGDQALNESRRTGCVNLLYSVLGNLQSCPALGYTFAPCNGNCLPAASSENC